MKIIQKITPEYIQKFKLRNVTLKVQNHIYISLAWFPFALFTAINPCLIEFM